MPYEISTRPEGARRFLVIACEVLFREVCHLTARCPHTIDHVWLGQGLHELGSEKMGARIQDALDAVAEDAYDAILLGYALCNNGILGLTARHTPLVVPRAHDCITLFLGSRQRYQQYFDAHPGTYYLTTGWMERDERVLDGDQGQTIPDQLGLGMGLDELKALYGEDNAAFLLETMGNLTEHYNRIAYIQTDFDRDLGFLEAARATARDREWDFDVLDADLGLLERLLGGTWNEDFLIIEPGQDIRVTYDESILCAGCSAGA